MQQPRLKSRSGHRPLFAVGLEAQASDGEHAPAATACGPGSSEAVQTKRIRCSESQPTLAPVRDHKTLCCALDRCQPGGFAGQRDIESRPTSPRSAAQSAPGDFSLHGPRPGTAAGPGPSPAPLWPGVYQWPAKTGKVLVHPGGHHRSRKEDVW